MQFFWNLFRLRRQPALPAPTGDRPFTPIDFKKHYRNFDNPGVKRGPAQDFYAQIFDDPGVKPRTT